MNESKTDVRMFTSIHTRISSRFRISSIYRKYENPFFTKWAWETLVWDDESIIEQQTSNSIDAVMKWHKEFYETYSKEES